jgi:hypothetical protein
MSDTLDNQTEQQYNQPQSPEESNTELSREELQNQLTEKYEQVLLSNNLEEITKVEEELQKFLNSGSGVESSAKVGEPEVPPANTEANQSTTTPAEGGTSAKEGATSQQQSSNPNEDWLNSLDPSVRKIVEDKLETERKAREYHEQRYRSEVGRQTAFQKKYEEERKAREQLELKLRDGAVSQPSNPTATPANTQTATAKKTQELTEKIARVKNTDSELADLLETTRDALLETQQLMASSVPKVDMSAVEELKAKIYELGTMLPEWMREMLDIRSPSRVFEEIGGFIGEGLARFAEADTSVEDCLTLIMVGCDVLSQDEVHCDK